MAKSGAIRRATGIFPALLAAFALVACAGLPRIGGEPLPPETGAMAPVYRDLADIPEPPAIAPQAANEAVIQSLATDRAKTAQAAEDLRRESFSQPDPSTPVGF